MRFFPKMKVFCSIHASRPSAIDSLRNVCRHKIFDSKHQNHFEASYERFKEPKMRTLHRRSACTRPGPWTRCEAVPRSHSFPASIHALSCRYLPNSNSRNESLTSKTNTFLETPLTGTSFSHVPHPQNRTFDEKMFPETHETR